jgi:flagellar biosynthesis/type III secretory pathway chaperone
VSERDAARDRADSLLRQLERTQGRLATAEAAAALQREALAAANARGAALASEAMEVQRLNRALQLRLEKAEAARDAAEAARAEADARAARQR